MTLIGRHLALTDFVRGTLVSAQRDVRNWTDAGKGEEYDTHAPGTTIRADDSAPGMYGFATSHEIRSLLGSGGQCRRIDIAGRGVAPECVSESRDWGRVSNTIGPVFCCASTQVTERVLVVFDSDRRQMAQTEVCRNKTEYGRARSDCVHHGHAGALGYLADIGVTHERT
jgi:hypothetical protein